MKYCLVAFTILLAFNYQGFSRDAPTTGGFELFYPMMWGFLRGVVETENSLHYPYSPFKTAMDLWLAEFNNTLICINENVLENIVNKQFKSLFANSSDLLPFDIRNTNANLTFVWGRFYNMIINAWSIAFDCLTSNPFKPQMERLLLYTNPNIIFEMYNALKINHSSDANILLNKIIYFYFGEFYHEMGYYIYQLVLLGMKDFAHYYSPPYAPATPPIPESFNITIVVTNWYSDRHVFTVKFIANLLSISGSSLPSINCTDFYPSDSQVRLARNHNITFPSLVLGIRVYKVVLTIAYYDYQGYVIQEFRETHIAPNS